MDVDYESTFSCVIGFDSSVVQLHDSVRDCETEARPTIVTVTIHRDPMKR